MAFLFRKKKPNKKRADTQHDDGDDALHGQVEELQGEVNFLKKRLLSIQAKVPSVTPSSTGTSRQAQLPAMVEEAAHGVEAPSSRTPSIAWSEATRRTSTRQDFDPRLLNDEVAAKSLTTMAIYDPVHAKWRTETSNRTIPVKTSSIASSKGGEDVFYKDGKKYRRVVRVVRSTDEMDAGKPASFRSVSSAHGREEVTEGHVEAMRARFSTNGRSSDVSMGNKSSWTSRNANKGLRVRAVAESHPFVSPKQCDMKKSTSLKEWEERPSPIFSSAAASNPWLRKEMKRNQDQERAGRESQSPWAPQVNPTHAAGSPLKKEKNVKIPTNPFYTKRSTITGLPDHPDFLRTEQEHPTSYEGEVSKDDQLESGEKSTRKTTEFFLQKGNTGLETKNKKLSGNGVKSTFAFEGRNGNRAQLNRLIKTSAAMGTEHSSQFSSFGHSPSALEGIGQKNDLLDVATIGKDTSEMETSVPSPRSPNPVITIGRRKKTDKTSTFKISKESVSQESSIASLSANAAPANLLKEIRKQDVKLKKVPANAECASNETKVPSIRPRVAPTARAIGATTAPNDLLSCIRAGVSLKKVDESLLQSPKQHSSPMSELLAKIQEKKAEFLRKQAHED